MTEELQARVDELQTKFARSGADLWRVTIQRDELLDALTELTAWVDRAIVPGYDDKRKPMPVNCANALAKAHAAIAKATE